ncbi:hypothetical protein ACB092_06G058200 [Castanea dentata]
MTKTHTKRMHGTNPVYYIYLLKIVDLMCRIKLTYFIKCREKYYLYSWGQIRMKFTAIGQLQRGIEQILRSHAKMMLSFPMCLKFPVMMRGLMVFQFRNSQTSRCCCEKN